MNVSDRVAVFGKGVVWKKITTGQLIDVIAEEFPNREALVIDGIRKTYAEYLEDINKLTINLIELGISKGDSVGIMARNVYEWMVAWYALAKIGALIIPLDYWYKDQEAHYILEHSLCKGVLVASDYVDLVTKFKDLERLTTIVVLDDKLKSSDSRVTYYSELMKRKLTEKDLKKIQEKLNLLNPEDVCFVLYTSGTTGNPKGAMLTHNNIIGDCMEIAKALRAGPDDTYLIPVPFSHCFGNELGITMATLSGSKMVPLKDQTPNIALKAVTDEKCTIIHGTPTHFIRYLREYKDNKDKYNVSTLRSGVSSGALCPPDVMKEIMEILHVPDIVNAYGQTEVSPIGTITKVTDTMEHRIYTVGSHLPDVEVKCVDENNQEVPLGEVGEVCFRGWNVMKGYFRQPDKTAETIDKDNWIHTGDTGTMDAEGYLKIVGRKKDMINYGGAKVWPKVIEEFLLKNPKILEVAVVGVPDPEYIEVVAAAAKVQTGFTEQDLVDYCYGQINDFGVPRYVRFDLNIPLSGRGKIQKYKLVEMFKELKTAGKLGPKLVPTAIQKKKQQSK